MERAGRPAPPLVVTRGIQSAMVDGRDRQEFLQGMGPHLTTPPESALLEVYTTRELRPNGPPNALPVDLMWVPSGNTHNGLAPHRIIDTKRSAYTRVGPRVLRETVNRQVSDPFYRFLVRFLFRDAVSLERYVARTQRALET